MRWTPVCRCAVAVFAAGIFVMACPGSQTQPIGDGGVPDSTASDSTAPDSTDSTASDGSTQPPLATNARVLYLHHSTGGVIWDGGVSDWVANYNSAHSTDYQITEQDFPKASPYGWENYPYDYWNIWVNHAGEAPYQEEPTLEMLTQDYEVIVFKHCYPVSSVAADTGSPDITSSTKSDENYRLQYNALKAKLRSFADTRFIVWTGAALVAGSTNEAEATRAQNFFSWVTTTWDEPGDNIFVWDFRQLETEGGLYLQEANAAGATNSHPNDTFATTAAPLFGQRLVDVIEGRGDTTSLTGQ